MSSRNKKPYKDIYASLEGKDYFGTIYDGLVKSEAFKNLSLSAKLLYMYCRVEAKSTQGKSCLYNHANQYGRKYSDNCFVFPAAHLESYGLSRTNSYRYFKELIDAGFLDIIESGKKKRMVNVFAFSNKWKRNPSVLVKVD